MAAVMIRVASPAFGSVAIDSGIWKAQNVSTAAPSSGLLDGTRTPMLERFRGSCLESSLCSSSWSREASQSRLRPFRQSHCGNMSTRASSGASGFAIQERAASLNSAVQSQAATTSDVQTWESIDGTRSITEQQQAGTLEPGPQMGLIDDGLLFREKFVIRCYEVGTNRTASMETIANLLQEVACNHAQSVGFSTDGFATTPLMRERHLIWVTTRMHIEVDKYPVWGDTVEIDTWYQGEGKVETRRDWIIRKDGSGRVIGRATSTWVMMNIDTRRLSRVPDDVRAEYMRFVPLPARWAFPEADNNSTKRIGKLEDSAPYIRSNLTPRRNDLDMNLHVNNVTYIGWMLEGMPYEVTDTHEISEISLVYRRECKADDVVESLVCPETPETAAFTSSLQESKESQMKVNGTHTTTIVETSDSSYSAANSVTHLFPPLEYVHLLRLVDSGVEINRGRTAWRRKRYPKKSSQG